jgi:hypothetical protein
MNKVSVPLNYKFIISNNGSEQGTVTLFQTSLTFHQPNYGNQPGISVDFVTNNEVKYQHLLYDLQVNPAQIKEFVINGSSTMARKVTIVNREDFSTNRAEYRIISSFNFPFLISGRSGIEIELFPFETFEIVFKVHRKANLGNLLSGKELVDEFPIKY